MATPRFRCHALLLRQENYRDRDIETFIGTQQAKTKRALLERTGEDPRLGESLRERDGTTAIL